MNFLGFSSISGVNFNFNPVWNVTMRVARNTVVTIDYTLKNDQGTLIDSSSGAEPFAYIHGTGYIIPGLEKALEGKTAGDSLQVDIPPQQGYGERDESLVQVIPLDTFESPESVREGMQFQMPTEHGMKVVTAVEVDDEGVTVDGNHPLAGVHLNFDVTIVEVREASDEELSHGHVHGTGGHHH